MQLDNNKNFDVMKKNIFVIALIVSALAMMVVSCKPKPEPDPDPNPGSHWWSPDPGPGGALPTSVLPDSLTTAVTEYFTINSGANPPVFDGQFVSSPHVLIHSTNPNDTVTLYNDRYIAFFLNNGYIDFYGKQWDNEYAAYYEEAYRKLHVVGTGENFSCYYLTEGYPNGMYAKQSTVFSGKWNSSYGGLKDFQVAVILLETSGNPNLAPAGTFRVLGDGDGLARDTNWMAKKNSEFNTITVSDEDAFRMFRVK